ncbi:hypothetical protein V500_10714 [Pseudogymnoascus sp. VKM F-4518 (FW-2643)]|nr:hypothetical protein V500_10714 [Pseudogymnoascus sp. VKM F-4518 (FW-2643)]
MFKFVTADVGAQKRKQVSGACSTCRKRKKRCHHSAASPPSAPRSSQNPRNTSFDSDPTTSSDPHTAPAAASMSPTAPLHGGDDPATMVGTQAQRENVQVEEVQSQSQPQHERAEDVRSQSQAQSQENLGSRFIGDLSPEGIFLAATSPDANRGASMGDSVGVWLTNTLNRRASQGTPFTLADSSPANIFYRSVSLVQKVLVPVLEQECLATMPPPHKFAALSNIYFEKIHPIFPVIDENIYHSLNQTDPRRILLQQGVCLAASKNFAAKEHLFLGDADGVLKCREFGDRIGGAMRICIEMALVTDRIVLIQVLTLMSQFIDGPDGGDLSSQLCSLAVHHVHSIGLHVRGEEEILRDQYATTLLICIWAVDRMNAAMNGRPVQMHERDLSTDLQQCFEQQKPCFRLFIEVVNLLDKVIGLYRPSAGPDPFLDVPYPSFEDLVVRCGGLGIGTSSMATIETLYHAVTILSCRSKWMTDLQRSSAPYIRQSLSTSTLSSTVGRELHDQLVLFPFVPYALSLSLSIAYREMRHGKIPLHRARARAQFQTICDALSDLRDVYRSAATTAELGKKLLKEMDRVVSTVAVSGTKTPMEATAQNQTHVGNMGNRSSALAVQNLPNQMSATDGEQIPSQTWQDFDPSIFDTIADVDLFGKFDPSFNLDGFDACLESNLDPSFPTYFQ